VPDTFAESTKMTHLHTVPDDTVTVELDISGVWDVKMAAIQCHKSQIDASPILEAPEEQQKIFLGTEFYQPAVIRNNNKNLLTRKFIQ
jgi:LmbE family N-acetylglucosaminyl deacetylase